MIGIDLTSILSVIKRKVLSSLSGCYFIVVIKFKSYLFMFYIDFTLFAYVYYSNSLSSCCDRIMC